MELRGAGLFAMFIVFAVFFPSFNAESATIAVDPVTQSSPLPGGELLVQVKVENVEDLYAYQFDLAFDNTAIQFSSIEERGFLTADGSSSFANVVGANGLISFDNIDEDAQAEINAAGKVTATNTRLGSKAGADGTGVLIRVVFQVLELKSSLVRILAPVMLDSQINAFPVEVENGTIEDSSMMISIPLYAGWNLISLPIQPDDDSVESVLASIAGMFDAVWTQDPADKTWKRFVPGGPATLNNLATIDAGRGYWIMMNNAAQMDVWGRPVGNRALALISGWNLVGYQALEEMLMEDAVASIDGNYDAVYYYDPTTGAWERSTPEPPETLNSLDSMGPGRGYWINTHSNCQWDINQTR